MLRLFGPDFDFNDINSSIIQERCLYSTNNNEIAWQGQRSSSVADIRLGHMTLKLLG